jgi:STE24 endopeptidase
MSADVKPYQRRKLLASVIHALLALGTLTLLALLVGPRLGALYTAWLGPADGRRLLAAAAVVGVALELVTLPVAFWSGYLLEHRYGLSTQTLAGWLWKRLKTLLVGGVLGLVLVYGLYGLLWRTGASWWAWAALGWLGLTLVLGRIMPVVILPLFYKVTPLDDAQLTARLERLAAGTGLSIAGVYQLELSAETRKANAALAGLGRARRVLLGDTLLAQFTPEEIEVVFAHELGHHVHRHLTKSIVVGVVLAAAGFFLVDRVLTLAAAPLGYAALDDPAALPLVLLVLALFGLVLSPLENALSRAFEHQSDAYALKRTGNAAAYRSTFEKLAQLNKADLDPHPLVAWLFYDHPPIRARLARVAAGPGMAVPGRSQPAISS